MIQLQTCNICEAEYSTMREHCPACGSRRAFLASHSYERYEVLVIARNAERLEREVVRTHKHEPRHANMLRVNGERIEVKR